MWWKEIPVLHIFWWDTFLCFVAHKIWWYNLSLSEVCNVLIIEGANGLYRHSNSACYGNHNNFIHASCPENNERVLLDKLYVYAKPMNTSCPVQSNSNTPASCCQAETGDCGFEYDGESKHIYFQNCVGRTTCSWSRAAWSNIMLPCTTSVHRSQSSYMTAYYYCISGEYSSRSGFWDKICMNDPIYPYPMV